jgi:hypothetical protein
MERNSNFVIFSFDKNKKSGFDTEESLAGNLLYERNPFLISKNIYFL